jgi:site-specific recombinase XerD
VGDNSDLLADEEEHRRHRPGGEPAHIEARLERRGLPSVPSGAPLFCTRKGTPTAAASVSRRLHELACRAGIDKRVHPHGFRYAHAIELMMEGIPMSIIRCHLGHASLATTDRYLVHIDPKQVIAMMNK